MVDIPIQLIASKEIVNSDVVDRLSGSIKDLGLLNPITVLKASNDSFDLVAGNHRLAACKKLGWKEIAANVVDLDKLDAELATIDENLIRKDITVLERADLLSRRNEILKAKGQRAKKGKPSKKTTVDHLKTTSDIAQELGKSKSTVKNDLRIASGIVPEAKENIRETQVADSTRDLLHLAKLEPKKQIEVSKAISKGESKSVREAIITISGKEREKHLKVAPIPALENIKLIHGNFIKQEIIPDSIDLLLTDPPYKKEYLDLWRELSHFAFKVLKPGAFLVSYSGQEYLPEVMEMLGIKLKYFWLCGLEHTGPKAQIYKQHVQNAMKPILIYAKEPVRKPCSWFQDLIQSNGRDKKHHKWGQSIGAFKYLIDRFSKPGDLILDPMMGGGTSAIASIELKRHFIGIDVDEKYVKETGLRVKELFLNKGDDNAKSQKKDT